MSKKIEKLKEVQLRRQAQELVLNRYNISKSFTQSYFSKFTRFYQLYRGYLDKGRLPWRSNLSIPKTFEIIETVAPRVAQAQRTWTSLPVEGQDVQSSEVYADLLKFQFEQDNAEDKIEELVKETLIYGTGVAKCMWMQNRPSFEVVDIFDFFPDPKARNDQELKYAIHRIERDIEDLEKNPNYDKAVLKALKETKDAKSPQDQWKNQRLGLQGANDQDGSRQRFEVLEYHGYFNGEIYVITVAGGEVLRMDKSPYGCIPFVVVRDQIIPHELYGIGEVEPVESLQNELNDIRNQRMDNIKLNINKMFKVVAGGVQFEDELVSRPGGIIHLTRPDGLLENDTSPVPAEAFTEESIIKSDMERADGANSSLSGALVSPMGGTQGGVVNRTATAFQGSINQADKRFSAKSNQIKRGLIRIGRLFLEMDQQLMSKKQVIRIVGEEGMALAEVYPKDIKGNFDLQIDVEYLDEFQQMQQNMQILEVAKGIPGFDVSGFLVHLLERAGQKDIKRFLKPPQPPQPEPPKINLQLKGEITPDAVAQLMDKHEGVKSNPELVGALMRAAAAKENEMITSNASTAADAASTMNEQNSTDAENPQEESLPTEE